MLWPKCLPFEQEILRSSQSEPLRMTWKSKELFVADPRVANFAKVLVEHSARIVPGDRVLIEATTAAEPLVRELYIKILEKGGHPHSRPS